MAANWAAQRGFWFARSPWSHRRLIFMSRIGSAEITGLDAYAASPGELNGLDKKVCRYLRALSKGKAYEIAANQCHGSSWTNAQLLHKWRVLAARAEVAIRRVKWWQAMTEHNHAHLQTMAAIWGQLPDKAPTLTSGGFLEPKAYAFAVAFSEGLHLFAGLSGTEDFLELWEVKHFSVVSIFDDENKRDAFHPAHGFQALANSSMLQSSSLGHTDGENGTPCRSGGSREACVLIVRRSRTMWHGLRELEKVHGAPNTQERQPRHKSLHFESQSSRINVSTVAAHSKIDPQRKITSSAPGPLALAGQIAVT